MEILFFIIVIWLFVYFVTKPSGPVVEEAVTGKKNYFGPPQVKFVDDKLEDSDLSLKRIMFRGKIPVNRPMQVGYSISAFDVTDGDDDIGFIISMVESQQEPDSVCFGVSSEFGRTVEVGDTFTDWVQLGVILPDLIQTKKSGIRKIQVLIRLHNVSNAPTIRAGYHDGGEIILSKFIEFDHFFTEKGYEEAAKDREEAQALSLKIGVAVAMADGTLDDSEGEVLKNWILREVSVLTDEKSEQLKKLFNQALKEGYAQAQSGTLSLSSLVDRLSEIGEKKAKYDAIELAFDVMAADGVAHPEEMAVIRNVAKALDLDMDEIEKMREGVTLNLSTNLTTEDSLESLLGIEDKWTGDQKKKHLRSEFQKWSNRLNSLPEGDERESAQNMLDSIASLRKKYG